MTLHSPDMTGRCMSCGEQVGSSLAGCKTPPYVSPRERELLADNAKLRAALQFIADNAATIQETECGNIPCNGSWCKEQARAALQS